MLSVYDYLFVCVWIIADTPYILSFVLVSHKLLYVWDCGLIVMQYTLLITVWCRLVGIELCFNIICTTHTDVMIEIGFMEPGQDY